MNVRRMTEADSTALLQVWNSAARFDPLMDNVFSEKVWEDEGIEPGFRLVGEIDGHAAGFAVGAIRDKEEGRTGYVKMIAVHPVHQRRGLGTELLGRLEKRLSGATARAIRVGESAPNYLSPGVDVRYTKATVFFENHEYRNVGQAYNMEVDLASQDFTTTNDESKLRNTGFAIRRAEVSDTGGVMDLLAGLWPSWREEVGMALLNDPISLFLALRDGKVVAFSAHETNNRGTGWFGPMGTAPEARGRGIGSVLLKKCLADLREMGFETAVIPWVAPISFYLHHVGAEVSRTFVRYEKKTEDAKKTQEGDADALE